jgi:hypothetical protein
MVEENPRDSLGAGIGGHAGPYPRDKFYMAGATPGTG